MKITIGCDPTGTHLKGYIHTSYKDIIALLGKGENLDNWKSDAGWQITINDKPITIYNYKDGRNYNGRNGIPKTQITDWHIGGRDDITEECKFLAKKLNGKFIKA